MASPRSWATGSASAICPAHGCPSTGSIPNPTRLFHGVVGAIQSAANKLPLPGNDALLALDQGLAHDRAASYDLLLGALEHLTEPIVLVIDDVHLAGPGLAERNRRGARRVGPPAIAAGPLGTGPHVHPARKVPVWRGTWRTWRRRTGLHAGGSCPVRLFAGAGPAFDAGSLWKVTAGWPVAVHASLVSLAQSAQRAAHDADRHARAHTACRLRR